MLVTPAEGELYVVIQAVKGVENRATMESLREQGCDTLQGYYISKPLPVEEFLSWLRKSEWG